MNIPKAGDTGPWRGDVSTRLYPVTLYQRSKLADDLFTLASDHGPPMDGVCKTLAVRISNTMDGKPFYPAPATHTHEARKDDLYDFTDSELALIRTACDYVYKKTML